MPNSIPNPINDDLRFRAPHSDGTPRADARNLDASLEQLTENVDQLRTHLLRAKRRMDRAEQQCDSLTRYVQALVSLLVLVVVGCGGLAWYGASQLRNQRPIVVENVNPKLPEPKLAEVVPTPPPSPSPATVEPRVTPEHEVPPEVPVEKPDNTARQRVDFQVESNQTVQVASGIYLTVKSTDLSQHTVDGWLQIAKDGRIVWIRSQEAERSLSFESKQDAHPSYLFFTRVEPHRVAGYLMLPLPKGEVVARRQTGNG